MYRNTIFAACYCDDCYKDCSTAQLRTRNREKLLMGHREAVKKTALTSLERKQHHFVSNGCQKNGVARLRTSVVAFIRCKNGIQQ